MHTLTVCDVLLAGNEKKYVNDCLETAWISSSGKYVEEFEKLFTKYCSVKHGIAVCNGTVALHLALQSLNIGPGDEIIIPDFTMIASAFSVCYTGAIPVFIDADKDTWNICVRAIENKISKRTKAIMAVHIFGNPCDMFSLRNIADKYGLVLIEDAAEAHGALFNGKKVGSLSSISSFSFFANKNITTGEGGMVVTDNDDLAKRCRYYRNMCFPLVGQRNYLHNDIGFNYRMSNIHAAIGLAQTERADYYRTLRIKNGLLYRNLLREIPGIILQGDQPKGKTVFWMNGVCVRPKEYGHTRNELMEHLKENGIDTRLFFNGMHRQPALRQYGCDCQGEYPVSDFLADNGFYLPSGSALAAEDIERVCDVIKKFRKK
jgi:perosamine synthetase